MATPHADLLREHGLSVTAQRLAVLRTVSAMPHATADAVTTAVRAELGTVSRQAVYFNGDDKLVLDKNPSVVLNNPAFTLAAWVKPENLGDSAKDGYPQGVIGMNAGGTEAYPTLQIVGRKLRAGTALRAADGEVLAVGRATWVQLTPEQAAAFATE